MITEDIYVDIWLELHLADLLLLMNQFQLQILSPGQALIPYKFGPATQTNKRVFQFDKTLQCTQIQDVLLLIKFQ